jgi:hypothetical protein
MRRLAHLACLAAVVLGPACVPTPPPLEASRPATIERFSVSPSTVAAVGERVTVSWSVVDAEDLRLEVVDVGPLTVTGAEGTLEVPIMGDSVFVLTARGLGGTDVRPATVRLLATQPPPVLFDVTPKQVEAGGSVTLVWNAPDAAAVSLRNLETGQVVDVRGQRRSGAVQVTVDGPTRFELDVDGRRFSTSVAVTPAIFDFSLVGDSPRPGEGASLSWRTGGARSLVLRRVGAPAPLTTASGANAITGTFLDLVPSGLPADGLVTWELEAEGAAGERVSRRLTIQLGGGVSIDDFVVPPFIAEGGLGVIRWRTTGATRVVLSIGGQVRFESSDLATAANGTLTVPAPTSRTELELVASNTRGAVSRRRVATSPVGPVVPGFFVADQPQVSQGGAPVTLRWSVTNARAVRIVEQGQGVVFSSTGLLDTGTATVFPNKPTVTYLLEADNTVGGRITPLSTMVSVGSPATLTFSRTVPIGSQATVTGSTVPDGGTIGGLGGVVKNAPGERFIDIRSTGTVFGLASQLTSATLVAIPAFTTVMHGRRVVASSISVSPNGWCVFSATTVTGPGTPPAPLHSGTTSTGLVALAMAPWGANLDRVSANGGELLWQMDGVPGGQRLIIQWDDVEEGATGATGRLTFQVQVYSSGRVVFAYDELIDLTAPGVIGIVNGARTATLEAPDQPVAGDTYTFFAPTTPPVAVSVDAQPVVGLVSVPGGAVEVEGDPRLAPGLFTITEVHARPVPAAVNGQWFEVTSSSTAPIDLDGWTIDVGGNSHTITRNLVLPPFGRLVLAQSAGASDGVAVDYVYPSSLSLSAGTGSVALELLGGPYAEVSWVAAQFPTDGASLEFEANRRELRYATGVTQLGCAGQTPYGTLGQRGTPGAANRGCLPYAVPVAIAGNFQSIASTGTTLLRGADGPTVTNTAVVTAPLARPLTLFGRTITELYVSSNGFVTLDANTAAGDFNKSLPSTTAPIGTLAVFWDNLQGTLQPGSGVFIEQQDPDGTPASGDERTIVSWEDWAVVSTTVTTSLSFQLHVLANGDLEYHYGAMSGSTGTTFQGSSATVWLEDRFGRGALAYSVNSATAPGIAPNTGVRFVFAP